MLDKTVFSEQIQRLVIEYGDKGFSMSKERASQWYEFFKIFSEGKLRDMITDCLVNVSHSPTMADILKFRSNPTRNPYRKVD